MANDNAKPLKASSNEIILVTYPQTGHHDHLAGILQDLSKSNFKLVVVDLNKSCASILQKVEGISPSKIFCVDCSGKKTSGNIISVKSPESLTELSIVLTNILNTGKFDFLVFDSPYTLLTYNPEKIVIKFMQYACNKLRLLNVGGVIIIPETPGSKGLIANVAQSADRRVSL